MNILSKKNLLYISAAGNNPTTVCSDIQINQPPHASTDDWHTLAIACGLFATSSFVTTIATASVRPDIPLWGMPVTLTLGLSLSGTAVLIGLSIDWFQSEKLRFA